MNVYTPPPPPGAPPVKKGLSPLAWVGIGCGVIILLGVVAMGVLGFFAKKQFDKFADNPTKAAAELVVRTNPDLELVSTDDKAGTMTIRDKKENKEFTLSFDDIKNGKFAITTADGTTTIDATSQDGIKVTDDKGNVSQLGATSNENLPGWIPTYPNGESSGITAVTSPTEKSGGFTVATSDSVDAVTGFYDSKLKDAGFQVTKTSFPGGANVTGSTEGDKRTLTVQIGSNEGKTQAIVFYSEQQ